MKRVLALVLSLLLVLSIVPISMLAGSNNVFEPAPAEGKIDVLTGNPATFLCNPACADYQKLAWQVTDGIVSSDTSTNGHYTNLRIIEKNKTISAEVPFMVDGAEKKYYYAFKFDVDNVTVDSFRVTWSGDNGASPSSNYESKVEVLISTDNGATWTSAYIKDSGDFGPSSDVTADNGLKYKIKNQALKQTYTNVTNIVYAALSTRKNSSSNYYIGRISEISFFGPANQPSITETGWHWISEKSTNGGSLAVDTDGIGKLTTKGTFGTAADFMLTNAKINLNQTNTLELVDLYSSGASGDRWCAVSLLNEDAVFTTSKTGTTQNGITFLIKNDQIAAFRVGTAGNGFSSALQTTTKFKSDKLVTTTKKTLKFAFSYNSTDKKYSVKITVGSNTATLDNDALSNAIASLNGSAYVSVGLQSANKYTMNVKAHLLPTKVSAAKETLTAPGHKEYYYDALNGFGYTASSGKKTNRIADLTAWLSKGGAGYLPCVHDVIESNIATMVPALEASITPKDAPEYQEMVSTAIHRLTNYETEVYSTSMVGADVTADMSATYETVNGAILSLRLSEGKAGWHMTKQDETKRGVLVQNGTGLSLETNGYYGTNTTTFAISDKAVNLDAEEGITLKLKDLTSQTSNSDKWMGISFLSTDAVFDAGGNGSYKGITMLVQSNLVLIYGPDFKPIGDQIPIANILPVGGKNVMSKTAESFTLTLKKVGGKYTLIFNDGQKDYSTDVADAALQELNGKAYISVGLSCADNARSNVTVELLANKVAGLEPTEKTSGYKACYKNQLNDRLFEDAAQTTPIADFKAWSSKGGAGYIPDLLHQDVVASNAVIDATVNGNSCDINSITDIVPNADIIIHAENNIDVMAFSFAPDAIQEIADYIAGSEYSLIIMMKDGSIKLGSSAMAVIGEKLNGSQFDLTLHYPAGPGDVTDEQIDAVGKYQVADLILVRMFAGKTVIRDFGDAELEIGFDGTLAKPVQALYLADDGKVERVPTTVRDGKVYLTTNHLSLYGYAEEEKVAAAELADAKAEAKEILSSANAADPLLNEAALKAGYAAIDSSATKAAVSSALAAGIENVQAAQAEELKDAKSSAIAALNETAAQGECSSAILSSAIEAVEAAATKAEVETAKLSGIEAIENDIFSGNLGGAKKLALDALAAQNELDPIDNEALLTELQNLINSSATVEAVTSNKEAAIASLKAEQKTELDAAIAAAKIAIEAADNADELNSSAVKDAGKKAVESGATKADVAEILSAAIADVNVAVAQELADAKTAAKADIDAQNEYDPLIDSSSVAAACEAIDAAATKRAVAAALNEGLRSVKNAQRSELSDALSAARTDVHNANAEDPLEGVNALAEIAMWLNFLNLDQSIKTKADAAEELSSAIASVKAMQLTELNAEKAEVLTAVNEQNETDPLIDSTAIRSAALLVDEAATKAAVRAIADEAVQLVKDAQAEELAAAKEDALEVLSSANAVDPLIDTAALDNANTAVENATTKAEVKQYKEAGVSNIAAAQAEELAAAKEAASSAIANGFNDARIYPENKADLIESQQGLVNGAKTKAEVAALLSKAEELIQAAEDNDVAAAKKIVIDELNTINDADPITSTAVLSAAIDAVNDCDTITGVVSASTGLYDTVRAEQALELADAKTAAKAALDAEDAKDPLNDKTALNDAKNAVDAMTTKALVEGAKSSGIAAVQQAQAIELKAAQDEAVKAVREEIKNDTNAKVLATAETEIGKINATGKKAEVEPAKTAAIQAVKDMRALVAAQEAAEKELNVAAGNKPSDAVKAIVSDGIAAIEAAATPAAVDNALTEALNKMYAQRAAEGLEKYCMLEGTELVDVTTASDAIYVSNAAFSKFVKVTVDSNALTAADFTVVEGSTRVTLKAAYLKTLANGTHTIVIDSGDGVAKYTFTVVGQAPAPDTGDHTMIYIAAVTAIIALGITALVAKKKREEI